MRNKIQRNMVFMIVLTLLASYAFIIGIVYNQTYRIMRQDARQEAAYIKEAINLLGSQYLQEMDNVNTDTRVTQIDEEGTVLYDSHGINSKDENHAQRKEIKEALEKGHGQAKRMSETVGQELYYYATLLEDGDGSAGRQVHGRRKQHGCARSALYVWDWYCPGRDRLEAFEVDGEPAGAADQ